LEYADEQPERIHLKEFSRRELAKRIEQAKELQAQGHSIREIAKNMSVSVSTAHKYVKTETPETPEIEIE
jgi:transposase